MFQKVLSETLGRAYHITHKNQINNTHVRFWNHRGVLCVFVCVCVGGGQELINCRKEFRVI